MSARAATKPTLVTIIDDGHVVGFALARGRMGYEAFSAADVPLGTYPNVEAARNAVLADRTSRA